MSRREQLVERLPSTEVMTFLAVGGTGYVVDVGAFNALRSMPVFASVDPSVARVVAVGAAMVVTYVGNRMFTWRGSNAGDRRREVALFVLFNVIGLSFSVVALAVSHDVMGLTSRLADNISANVVGLALGTVFRFWSYKRFVFNAQSTGGGGRDVGSVAERLPAATQSHFCWRHVRASATRPPMDRAVHPEPGRPCATPVRRSS